MSAWPPDTVWVQREAGGANPIHLYVDPAMADMRRCLPFVPQSALADRDRRIEALVAEVDSWKASYMALAPDHDVAMMQANSRIEALTKALRELVACLGEQQMGVPTPILLAARKALASAAGAEAAGARGME